MKVITVINAKGGCGKSTIAISLACCLARHHGKKVLLIDCDPQAQITEWTGAGNGIGDIGTITEFLRDHCVLSHASLPFFDFIPSSAGLERLGRDIEEEEGYERRLGALLDRMRDDYDFAVLDSPNQISPIMENAIFPADCFIVPFESAKAVKSYANFLSLLLKLRPGRTPPVLHVLSNVSRLPGLRKRVIELMAESGLPRCAAEIRSCGWLAQVDEHHGDIFSWRPKCNGAKDIESLTNELVASLGATRGGGKRINAAERKRESGRAAALVK